MCCLEDNVNKLAISDKLKEKLFSNKIKTIKELWQLKRKELKQLNFNDHEINDIIIALQLEGLDLNKKNYDK